MSFRKLNQVFLFIMCKCDGKKIFCFCCLFALLNASNSSERTKEYGRKFWTSYNCVNSHLFSTSSSCSYLFSFLFVNCLKQRVAIENTFEPYTIAFNALNSTSSPGVVLVYIVLDTFSTKNLHLQVDWQISYHFFASETDLFLGTADNRSCREPTKQ